MSRPQVSNPAPSTIRVRKFRARQRVLERVEELLYSTSDQDSMFSALELFESEILVKIAYPV